MKDERWAYRTFDEVLRGLVDDVGLDEVSMLLECIARERDGVFAPVRVDPEVLREQGVSADDFVLALSGRMATVGEHYPGSGMQVHVGAAVYAAAGRVLAPVGRSAVAGEPVLSLPGTGVHMTLDRDEVNPISPDEFRVLVNGFTPDRVKKRIDDQLAILLGQGVGAESIVVRIGRHVHGLLFRHSVTAYYRDKDDANGYPLEVVRDAGVLAPLGVRVVSNEVSAVSIRVVAREAAVLADRQAGEPSTVFSVVPFGQVVSMDGVDVEVASIRLDARGVSSYDVTWWASGGEYRSAWMPAEQVERRYAGDFTELRLAGFSSSCCGSCEAPRTCRSKNRCACHEVAK